MNCPNCNSPSLEGKKYCADCGASLDPETRRVDALIKAKVEDFVREKFKDQKAVEIDTSQAVLDRVERKVRQFLFFAGIPIALLLAVLTVSGIRTYRDFTSTVVSAQTQVKQKLEQAKGQIEEAQAKAATAKTNADQALKTIDTVTAQVNRQLSSATQITNNVQALNDRVTKLETQTSTQMQASSGRVDSEMKDLHQKIDAASNSIAEQEKKLESTDEVVKALFSKGVTEYFQTAANAPNIVIAPLQKGAIVFMLLKSTPINQTLEVKWRVFSQPRDSYGLLTNNLLVFNWGDPAENLKQYPLEITYVPDTTSKGSVFKALAVKDGAIFADGTKVMALPR